MAAPEQLTPSAVVLQLAALARELDSTVTALKAADLDATEKRHAADMAESLAFVRAEGSMDLRKHLARIEAGPQEKEALVAEAVVRFLKTRVQVMQTRISVGQSVASALRAELAALPYDQSA